MTESPLIAAEKAFRRRIMKIDIIVVREEKLNMPQGVTATGLLPHNGQTSRSPCRLHIMFGQVAGITLHSRVNFILYNAAGYIPVRAENNIFQLVIKNNSTATFLTHYYIHIKSLFILFVYMQHKFRNISHDTVGSRLCRQPSHTLQVDQHLL